VIQFLSSSAALVAGNLISTTLMKPHQPAMEIHLHHQPLSKAMLKEEWESGAVNLSFTTL